MQVVDRFRIQPFTGCLSVRYLVQKIFRRRVSVSPRKPQKFCDQECRPFKAVSCDSLDIFKTSSGSINRLFLRKLRSSAGLQNQPVMEKVVNRLVEVEPAFAG
jgi:hypothetical protein